MCPEGNLQIIKGRYLFCSTPALFTIQSERRRNNWELEDPDTKVISERKRWSFKKIPFENNGRQADRNTRSGGHSDGLERHCPVAQEAQTSTGPVLTHQVSTGEPGPSCSHNKPSSFPSADTGCLLHLSGFAPSHRAVPRSPGHALGQRWLLQPPSSC